MPSIFRRKAGPIRDMWAALFTYNEECYQAGQYESILTDEEITQTMQKSFPGRCLQTAKNVSQYRSRYNGGYLFEDGEIPVFPSCRYTRDEQGNVTRWLPRSHAKHYRRAVLATHG